MCRSGAAGLRYFGDLLLFNDGSNGLLVQSRLDEVFLEASLVFFVGFRFLLGLLGESVSLRLLVALDGLGGLLVSSLLLLGRLLLLPEALQLQLPLDTLLVLGASSRFLMSSSSRLAR